MIECIGFRKHESGTLQGFANFFIPKMGLEIYGCALHKKGERRWLNMPSKEIIEDGKIIYLSVIRFRDKGHFELFIKQAKEAIDNWVSENG